MSVKDHLQNAHKRGLFFVWCPLMLVSLASRLLPHPPNCTALTALSVLSSVHGLSWHRGAVLLMNVLLISDSCLGFHPSMFAVYGALLLNYTIIFFLLKHTRLNSFLTSALCAFMPSVLFFIITNFFVWWSLSGARIYPATGEGLVLCYTAALPFFYNQLLGDVFYLGAIVFAHTLLQRFTLKVANPLCYV